MDFVGRDGSMPSRQIEPEAPPPSVPLAIADAFGISIAEAGVEGFNSIKNLVAFAEPRRRA